MKSPVVALTDDAALSMSVVINAFRELGNGDAELCDPHVVTQASSLSKLPFESSSIDTVICFPRSEELPGDALFAEISSVLKPGGTISVYRTQQPGSGETKKATASLLRKLLLSGFLEAQAFELNSDSSVFGVKAKKPSWKIGSSFALKKSVKGSVKVQFDDDDAGLIDEDSLLTEEDLKKPKLPLDCEVGSTRKACKNCVCGRAEGEEKVKLGLTMDQINSPQSSCGSCGLGDAFRCGTCPYKGLPPFKPGEKVSFSSNFLTADI